MNMETEEQRVNIHGDHVASCLCCDWLDIGYEGTLSEVTPGQGYYCNCIKSHFYALDSDNIHKLQVFALHCPDFEGKAI